MTGEKQFVRRRETREQKQPVWWLPYRWEILAVLALIGGVLLIAGSGALRARLLSFLLVTVETITGRLAGLDTALGAFLARVTISDVLGAGLIVVALGLLLVRIRQRILNDPALAVVQCPRCGGHIHRIHRSRLDRVISCVVPVRRYACAAVNCHWKGLRVGRGHGSRR